MCIFFNYLPVIDELKLKGAIYHQLLNLLILLAFRFLYLLSIIVKHANIINRIDINDSF